MPLHDMLLVNCINDATTEAKEQLPNIWWLLEDCAGLYLTCHDYPSLLEEEERGI